MFTYLLERNRSHQIRRGKSTAHSLKIYNANYCKMIGEKGGGVTEQGRQIFLAVHKI